MHPSLQAPTPYPNCIGAATGTCCCGHCPASQRAVTNTQPFRVEVKAPTPPSPEAYWDTQFSSRCCIADGGVLGFFSVPVNSLNSQVANNWGKKFLGLFWVCVCKFSKEVLTLRIIYFGAVKKKKREGSNFKGQYRRPFIICTPDYSAKPSINVSLKLASVKDFIGY